MSEMSTFQIGVMLCKSSAMPMPSLIFKTTIQTFQMRYCMMFYLKGRQNCQKLKFRLVYFT